MQTLGIVFGAFCPLHQGHMDLIMRAKKRNDKCAVFVCGYDGDRGGDILPLKKRYHLIKEFLEDESVYVGMINDTELGIDESMSESNWEIWTKKLMDQLDGQLLARHYNRNWYVAEPEYKVALDKVCAAQWYGCDDRCFLIDRSENPISGTLCRSDPIKYWDKIAMPFRKYFSHNILIAGTASEGKTTLVHDIGNYFGIPYSYEKGRDIYSERTDREFNIRDFIYNLYEQQKQNAFWIGDSSNHGVFISDTDNMVTLMYAMAYSSRPGFGIDRHDYETLERIAAAYAPITRWNKIFLLPPREVGIVDDGQRYMPDSDYRIRVGFYNNLKDLYDKFGFQYTELHGDYYENFLSVKNYIKKLYGEER